MDVLQYSEWHLEMYKLTIWLLKITKYNYSSSLPVENTNHIFKPPCQVVLCFFFRCLGLAKSLPQGHQAFHLPSKKDHCLSENRSISH